MKIKIKVIQFKNFFVVALVGAFLLGGLSFTKGAAEEMVDPELEKIRTEIIRLVNEERNKEGLSELWENQKLNQAAFLKAQDMIGNNYFAHNSPSGVSPWDWFDQVGYQYKYAGENLAMNFSSALSVFKAWMKSDSHRENILSPRYNQIGVAVLRGIIKGEETLVAVQEFGYPLIGNEVTGGNELEIEEKIKQEFENTVFISEASIEKWKSTEGNEYLIYARVTGNPQKVEAVISEKNYQLEKLRENIYMNLIYIQEELKDNKIVIKAEIDSNHAQFFETYLAAKEEDLDKNRLAQKRDNSEDKKLLAGQLSSNLNQNEKKLVKNENLSFLVKLINQLNEQFILSLLLMVFLFLVVNVWVLEKEEERLLLAIEKKQLSVGT